MMRKNVLDDNNSTVLGLLFGDCIDWVSLNV